MTDHTQPGTDSPVMIDHSLCRRIETALYRHPAVIEAVTFFVPQENGAQSPVAFVTARDENLTGEALAAFIAACPDIAPHERPVKFVLVPEIPRTATGKFQKMELIKYLHGVDG